MKTRTKIIRRLRDEQIEKYGDRIRERVFSMLDQHDGKVEFRRLTMPIGPITNDMYREWLKRADRAGELIFVKVDGVEWIHKIP